MNLRPFVYSVLVAAMSFAAPSAFGNENIAVSAVSQDSSPITGLEENASCQSLPNNKGEIVFISFDASVKESTLFLRKNDNTIIKLFTYGAGKVAVTRNIVAEWWLLCLRQHGPQKIVLCHLRYSQRRSRKHATFYFNLPAGGRVFLLPSQLADWRRHTESDPTR